VGRTPHMHTFFTESLAQVEQSRKIQSFLVEQYQRINEQNFFSLKE
jgi:hypothetical protein